MIKAYSSLDAVTLEEIVIGHLVVGPGNATKADVRAAEKVFEAGIEPDWFEDKGLGDIYRDLSRYYRETRRLINIDEVPIVCLNQGQTKHDGQLYKIKLHQCLGALKARKISIDLLIERMVTRHLLKKQDAIYSRAARERADPAIGPRQSWENMRAACIKELVDPRMQARIQSSDWIGEAGSMVMRLREMRENPEKFRGCMCGIAAIDAKTHGFRSGHLAVFVGAHGGYKSMTMMNVAYGLWRKGHDVLYVSLEMEQELVQMRLWSLALGISFSEAYQGRLSDEQLARIEDFAASMKEKPNKLRFLDFGQSMKVKASQIEQWLDDTPDFKPHVVIVDYLDLMRAETDHWDRPDIAVGDVCKYLRRMGKTRGFSAITAAQLNRDALKLIRKHGSDRPDKAQLDTDCIASSHQIGADADNVFILINDGTHLRMFTSKARNGIKDIAEGERLIIDGDKCLVRDEHKAQPPADMAGEHDEDDVMFRPVVGIEEEL